MFKKEKFSYFGGYLTYNLENGERDIFIARFKHGGPFTKAKFLKELLNSHTVESYTAAMEKGESPLTILKNTNPSWYTTVIETWKSKQGAL
tara:strand:+ start:447 stop:719 length:273 start_codon:yes stop_codon:yes gene_type:complete